MNITFSPLFGQAATVRYEEQVLNELAMRRVGVKGATTTTTGWESELRTMGTVNQRQSVEVRDRDNIHDITVKFVVLGAPDANKSPSEVTIQYTVFSNQNKIFKNEVKVGAKTITLNPSTNKKHKSIIDNLLSIWRETVK